MGNLDNLKALITGSGGLMGGPIAVRLAQEGADVMLNDRVPGRTDVYQEVIRGLGREAFDVTASVIRSDGATKVVDAAIERWGRIDVLVNVVGGVKGPVFNRLWEMSEDDWDATIAVNLKGTFLCTRLVVPGMIERRFGKIINVASIAWAGDGNANPAYVAAKAGVVALTRALATSLAPYDINVNAVAPGVTSTRVLEKEGADTGGEGLLRAASSGRSSPLGRVNQPEDIADAVAYLVSPGARNVSGQLITIAGGLNPTL